MAVFSKPLASKSRYRVHILITIAVLLLSRSRLAALRKLGSVGPLRSDKATPEELKKAQQQLYVEEQDGSKTLLLPFQKRVSKVGKI